MDIPFKQEYHSDDVEQYRHHARIFSQIEKIKHSQIENHENNMHLY